MKKETRIKIYSVIVLGLFLLNAFHFVSAQSGGLTPEQAANFELLMDNIVIKILIGNPGATVDAYEGYALGRTGAIISHIALWAMLFVLFSDIFGGFLPLTNKFVPWVLGAGFTIIIANFGFIPTMLRNGIRYLGWLGTGAVFVAMGIAILAFVAATFFGGWLKIKILNKKREWAGKAGSKDAARAIENLAEIEKSMEKAGS